MDELKKVFREGETGVAKTSRGADGTDLSDHAGNIGDEARKNVGNVGDTLGDAGGGGEESREGADRTYPDPQVSDKQY